MLGSRLRPGCPDDSTGPSVVDRAARRAVTSSARTLARSHHSITSAGSASTVLTMKKVGQPMLSASTPASGPTQTRPTEAKAESSANCVAVKRWLHRLIRKATKAAVPMPPERFSKATTISRPPSTGVGAASATKPQSKAGSVVPGMHALAADTASHQKPRLLASLQHAEEHAARATGRASASARRRPARRRSSATARSPC